MKLHLDDYERAMRYQATALTHFPHLTDDQRRRIRQRAKEYQRWFRAHPLLHNTVSMALLAGLFAADLVAILVLPAYLPWSLGSLGGQLMAGLVSGLVHGSLVCSIVTYSLHEGAAHDRIIQGQGRVARMLRVVANNACRLFLGDPVHYAQAHYDHHRSLGTPEDGSFTNFVRGRRLLGAILPMAPFLDYSDYFPWRPQEKTRSRLLSVALTNLYLGALLVLSWQRSGFVCALVSLLVVGGWVSFVLDRLRESVEHLFMPLDRHDGTRELGPGFWGLLLGGGPWGQPCHLSHHLAPSLPWYQQLGLHVFLRRVLTRDQKRHFFARPVIGVPALLWRLMSGAGTRTVADAPATTGSAQS